MNIMTKTTLYFSKILIFVGYFSAESWGMAGIPNDMHHSGQFSRSDFNEYFNSIPNLDEQSDTLKGHNQSTSEPSDNQSDTVVFLSNDVGTPPPHKKRWSLKEQISKGNPYLTEPMENFYELLELLGREKSSGFIFDMLWNKCFDQSFRIKKTKVVGIYMGVGEDKNSVFFAKKGIKSTVDTREEKGYLYSEKNQDKKIEGELTDTVLFGIRPEKLLPDDVEEVRKYIKEIMENPVGYRLILLFLAKHLAQDNKYKKIKLVKVQSKISYFKYVSGENLWSCSEYDQGYQDNLDKQSPRHRFFIFSSSWLDNNREVPFMRLGEGKNDFTITWELNPKDIDVLTALISSQHSESEENCNDTVKQIVPGTNWSVRFTTEGDSLLLKTGSVERFIFSEDETLRTMHGATSKGIDLMNVDSYSTDKYKAIIFSNIKDKRNYFFEAEQFSEEQHRLVPHNIYLDKSKLLFFLHSTLNSNCVNKALFKYYLSNKFMKDFNKRFPYSNIENSSAESTEDFDNSVSNGESIPKTKGLLETISDYLAFFLRSDNN